MTESGAVIGALACAGGGLLVTFYRLRLQYDAVTAAVATALLAGATSLSAAMISGGVFETITFAALAALSLALARVQNRLISTAILAAASTVVGLVGPRLAFPPTLFAAANGFLALAPVTYVAVIGTCLAFRKQPAEFAAAMIALLVWPFASVSLTPAVALLAPGLAFVIDAIRRRPVIALVPLVVGVIVWNYWLMVQYTIGLVPKDAPVSFAAMVRQQADVHTRAPFVYPFAFPGNVVSAWRAGIPLGRYDGLSAEPRRESFDISFDRTADRFLLEGWGTLGSDAVGPYRPVVGERAELAFPLQPGTRDIEIHVAGTVRGRSTNETASIELFVNGYGVGQLQLSPDASDIRITVPADEVGRIFRAGYNRLSIVTSGPARLAVHRVRITPSA